MCSLSGIDISMTLIFYHYLSPKTYFSKMIALTTNHTYHNTTNLN